MATRTERTRLPDPATNVIAMFGRRIAVVLQMIATVLLVGPAALAQGEGPAVEAPQPPPVDETLSWTYRFLIPTLLVLAVLVVVVTVVQYFVRVVRARYRVVQ